MRFAALWRLGLRKTAVGRGLKSDALCAVFLRHIFLCAKIASQFFYRAQKTSHTAGTLYAIVAEMF
jgi:hypothetical protein